MIQAQGRLLARAALLVVLARQAVLRAAHPAAHQAENPTHQIVHPAAKIHRKKMRQAAWIIFISCVFLQAWFSCAATQMDY